VWDKADQCFKGLLDHRDLCEVLIRLFRTKRRKSFADLLTSDVELATLLEMGLALEAPAELVANVSKKHPLVSVKTSDPLTKLLEHFCSGTHRVFVFDSAGSFLGVLSQSDLIKMLNAHQKELGPVLSRSVGFLSIPSLIVSD
jgi:CBS-domain-containing membrane protein